MRKRLGWKHPSIAGSLEQGWSQRVCGFLQAAAVLVVLSGCNVSNNGSESNKVNGSIDVPAGKPPMPASTVNGSIQIDAGAAVTTATTVNGGVRLGDRATATSLESVNGSISLGAGAHVSGNAESVNGDLTLSDGAEILGSLTNVNGTITLNAAHVGGGIKTVTGS